MHLVILNLIQNLIKSLKFRIKTKITTMFLDIKKPRGEKAVFEDKLIHHRGVTLLGHFYFFISSALLDKS